MKSIFLTTAKKSLKITVRMARDASRDADNTNIWGLFRDKKTSTQKQHKADLFPQVFDNGDFVATNNDREDWLQLKELVHNLKQETFHLSLEQNGEGNFGQYMAIANDVLDSLYYMFARKGWLDIPNDDTPYHTLLRYAAEYEMLKLIEISHARVKNGTRTGCILTEEKRQLMNDHIQACKKNIKKLDSTQAEYRQSVKEVVLTSINDILRENKEKVEEKGYAPSIGLFKVAFLSLEWTPSGKAFGPCPGALESCMESAREAVGQIIITQEAQEALDHSI